MKNRKICSFVEFELNYFREQCNFTDEELMYFNLKAKNDTSNIQIALQMNIPESKVSSLARQVKSKMKRVSYTNDFHNELKI